MKDSLAAGEGPVTEATAKQSLGAPGPFQTTVTDAEVALADVWCVFRHRSGELIEGLRAVSFAVPKGQFVAVVGRSGHGKTTLLRVLAGLQETTKGQALVRNVPVSGPGTDRGMVFQQDTIFPWMHVRDNVEFGLKARGIGKRERREQSDRWLQAVGLERFAESWPRELSGGMRKRVALAALLAAGCDIWLMDEPFGSLDYFTRRSLQDTVIRLWQETTRTVFFVTHDIEEALIVADRIVLLRDGRLVADLDVPLPRPRDEEVRATTQAVALSKEILRHLGLAAGLMDSTSASDDMAW